MPEAGYQPARLLLLNYPPTFIAFLAQHCSQALKMTFRLIFIDLLSIYLDEKYTGIIIVPKLHLHAKFQPLTLCSF